MCNYRYSRRLKTVPVWNIVKSCRTLKNCAIVDIHEHWWLIPLWDIKQGNWNIPAVWINLWTICTQIYLSTVTKNDSYSSSVILYEQLLCIIIYKSSKGVNKCTALIILTFVKLWHDSAPTKQILISVHGVFPSVYVWVRQRGAWKLHPYNSDAKIHIFIHFLPILAQVWNICA